MSTPLPLPRGKYGDQKNDLLHGIWNNLSRINGIDPAIMPNRNVRGGLGTSTEDVLLEIFTELSRINIPVSVQAFGAVGDGINDDSQAFIDAFKSNRTVLIPATSAYYKVSNRSTITGISKLSIQATGAKILNSDLTKATWLFTSSTDIVIDGGDWGYVTTPTANGGNSQHVMQFEQCQRVTANRIHVTNSPEMGVAITNSDQVTVQNSFIEQCWRDGTYACYSANINFLNNRYKNIKDDAMSFHDPGRSSERTFIVALGYSQATGCMVSNCTVENAYQGFGSVAGSNITVKGCTFRNIVLAGVALMNQKEYWSDGTAVLNNANVESNKFFNCCSTTTINGVSYNNAGQASTGRASIMVVSLGTGNTQSLTEPKRQSSVQIRNNYVYNSGALGMGCYSTDGLIVSNNTFQDCTVSGNSLGGSVVEIWECTGYVEESTNTVIDTRTTIQHVRGYNFSGVAGTMNNWVVARRTTQDGLIGNSPSLVNISATSLFGQIKAGAVTQAANGSTTAFAFPHGMGQQPAFVSAQGNREQAKFDGIVADATSIVVQYKTAPTAGNITWYWNAKL